MKRALIGLMAAALAVIGFGSPASAAAKLQSFASSTGATVAIGLDGASATITLDASSVIPYPHFGGVYVNAKNQGNKLLNAVSFSFVSNGAEAGGAPRFSIPINTGGDSSSVAGYAFIDAPGCLGSSGATVTVSTNSTTCGVNFQSVEYPNWATFAGDFPAYRIAAGAIPFIIADGAAGNYAINSIQLT
jgi:hypothetical protein